MESATVSRKERRLLKKASGDAAIGGASPTAVTLHPSSKSIGVGAGGTALAGGVAITTNAVNANWGVEAKAQVSRFHTETLETTSRELFLRNICIACGGVDLLVDSTLHVFPGHRYGLLGRNGVGKSTLLRSVASGKLPGFPANMRALYVQQEVDGDDRSSLDWVLAVDTERTALLEEEKVLREAVSSGPAAARVAAKRVLANRALAAAEDARVVADKRSRQRGKAARVVALAAEAAAAEAVGRASSAEDALCDDVTGGDGDSANSGDSGSDDDAVAEVMLAEIYDKLEEMDADSAKSRATTILRGLGFDDVLIELPTRKLSGGWRMRVSLARALFRTPDVLMLDEPTNHLDLDATIWLEGQLRAMEETAVIVVSHDARFLNAVTTDTLVLRNKKLATFPGNYDAYTEATAEMLLRKQRLYDVIEKRRAHILDSIEKAVKTARASGDDKRLGMVASRKKKLERLGQERHDDGRRWRESYDGFRKEVTLDTPDPPVTLKIPEADTVTYQGSLLRLASVGFSYVPDVHSYPSPQSAVSAQQAAPASVSKAPAASVSAPVRTKLFSAVDMDVFADSRIGLVGSNGSGKSSLLRVIAGLCEPTEGAVQRHPSLRVGLFAQHAIDDLTPQLNSVEHMMRLTPGLKELEYRQFLGGFGISGKTALVPAGALSGGQKARLALALCLAKSPHVLLLDEPTNHLDLDTIEALAFAANEYGGGVIVASHDGRLLDAMDCDIFLVEGGKVGGPLANGFEEYASMVKARVAARNKRLAPRKPVIKKPAVDGKKAPVKGKTASSTSKNGKGTSGSKRTDAKKGAKTGTGSTGGTAKGTHK